jgi:4-hydroxy-tetrahydrodipicolinate synthase
VRLVQAAKKAGADAALVVPPYYNRPNQRGILAHFEMLAKGCDLPIIAYNVPARPVTDINCDTMAHMANAGWIKGVKDATGELDRVGAHRGACGADFCQLSGNDDIALGHYAMGGAGCVSVSANVAPRLCADFQAALTKGDMAAAQALQDKLFPLHKALFSDASPGPVKYALSKVRADFPLELRLPMTAPSAESCAIVDAALAHADLV